MKYLLVGIGVGAGIAFGEFITRIAVNTVYIKAKEKNSSNQSNGNKQQINKSDLYSETKVGFNCKLE